MTQQALVRAVQEYQEDTGNLSDDLREHDIEDLMNKYDLDRNEAGMFWFIIQGDQGCYPSVYGLPDEDSKLFLQTVQEAVHQDFEGPWTDYDRIVIQAFLGDIAYATYLTKKG